MSDLKQNPKSNYSPYLRLTSAGLQMAGVITAFSFLGYYFDTIFKLKTPWWTIILGLTGVGMGLYLIIREVMEISKKNDE
jgi:F0F1-type ATP synthase assembly protein I